MLGPGDAHDHEEVLVDGDHRHRPAVAGEPAQGVGHGLDVVEQVVGELLDGPRALLAEGGQGEVDPLELVGHGSTSHRCAIRIPA